MIRRGAPGSGEGACVLGEATGGVGSPDFALDLVGASGVATSNSSGPGAERSWRLRGNEEEGEAIKKAWSQGRLTATLMRIDAGNFRQKWSRRGGAVTAGEDDDEVAVGSSGSERGREGVGSTSHWLCG